MEGDVKEAPGGIGGPDAANAAGGDIYIALDIDGIAGEAVRQRQDFIGVIGLVGRGVNPGGGQGAGGHAQLVQVEGAGGLDVELVRRGLAEGAGAHQIAIDEVIDIPIGDGHTHGYPLVPVAVIGEIGSNILRGRPRIVAGQIVGDFSAVQKAARSCSARSITRRIALRSGCYFEFKRL